MSSLAKPVALIVVLMTLATTRAAPAVSQEKKGFVSEYLSELFQRRDFSPELLAELEDIQPEQAFNPAEVRTSPELAAPVRLEADGKPIDIGELSGIAHAGPWIADVDEDGDRDLLVGDFPGHFHLFENEGTDEQPVYHGKGKLQAGGVDAKTPVY